MVDRGHLPPWICPYYKHSDITKRARSTHKISRYTCLDQILHMSYTTQPSPAELSPTVAPAKTLAMYVHTYTTKTRHNVAGPDSVFFRSRTECSFLEASWCPDFRTFLKIGIFSSYSSLKILDYVRLTVDLSGVRWQN